MKNAGGVLDIFFATAGGGTAVVVVAVVVNKEAPIGVKALAPGVVLEIVESKTLLLFVLVELKSEVVVDIIKI
jgi:hypothetical protein